MGLNGVCGEGDIRVKKKRIRNCEHYCFVNELEATWQIFSLIYWSTDWGILLKIIL